MEVAIESGVDGLAVSLGFRTQSERDRATRVLAPGCQLDPAVAPKLARPHMVGVTHRVQGVAGIAEEPVDSPQTLLDKLESLGGAWCLFLHCETTPFDEILSTSFRVDRLAEEAARNLNTTQQVTGETSTSMVSHVWSRVQDWLKVVSAVLSEGTGIGMWTVDTWVLATTEEAAELAAGALHASIPGRHGRWFETLEYSHPSPGEPAPTSALTSRDMGGLLASPRVSQPGLAVRRPPPGDRRPSTGPHTLRLGSYPGTGIPASVALEDLEGHAFLTGTTGSGKSTTLHRLLADLWNSHHVPFLVLDPVKDDYSGVAQYFRGGIQIVRGADIHMNLLEAWPGSDRRAHITQVASAFRGAFSMPSPTPYVVTQLFDRVAMLPAAGASLTLFDVRDMIPDLIASLGYAPEQEANIRAALMTRFNLLLAPPRAHRFSWPSSAMIQHLFTRPTVVTLGDLSDDEERSFVVILLAQATWARARARLKPKPVEHVLVLEEAHRILPEIDDRVVDPERGSAKQVSAGLLSAMMAEVRSCGEQVLVVDQSPSRVSADVSRNTNLKIAHRVVHPEDQRQVAGMLGLDEDRAGLLGELDRGRIILSTRGEPSAQTVSVTHIGLHATVRSGSVVTVCPPSADWACGAARPEAHYRAWQLGPRAARPMALFFSGVLWGDGDGKYVRLRAYRGLLALADGDQSLTECLAWAGLSRLMARRRSVGPTSGVHSAALLHGALYSLWRDRVPATRLATEGLVELPPVNGALVGTGYLTWEEREIAHAVLGSEPRNGLWALGSAAWRQEMREMTDYLKTRRAELTPALGKTGAVTFWSVVVRAAVEEARLTSDIGDQLIARALS
ncbi:ATP-binding protein [Enemella evansiae]|uniref:ATP-binding protein n=1 Tax=Enemella evansiae TaxID=2016499 RepID=UPI0015C685EF|nr:DUF87 domain-containing protein [Enemella evansiae]